MIENKYLSSKEISFSKVIPWLLIQDNFTGELSVNFLFPIIDQIDSELGIITIDSVFTPVKNVKYRIENYRVEQKTDYEKLIFEINTDGSIHPKDALTEAAKTLIHHFLLFSDERITLEADEIAQAETYDEESLHMRQLLKTKLIDMDLSILCEFF